MHELLSFYYTEMSTISVLVEIIIHFCRNIINFIIQKFIFLNIWWARKRIIKIIHRKLCYFIAIHIFLVALWLSLEMFILKFIANCLLESHHLNSTFISIFIYSIWCHWCQPSFTQSTHSNVGDGTSKLFKCIKFACKS